MSNTQPLRLVNSQNDIRPELAIDLDMDGAGKSGKPVLLCTFWPVQGADASLEASFQISAVLTQMIEGLVLTAPTKAMRRVDRNLALRNLTAVRREVDRAIARVQRIPLVKSQPRQNKPVRAKPGSAAK